jgi:hypothetical protein
VPVPSLSEQREITNALGMIDKQAFAHQGLLALLQDLTAQIRVDQVDLSELKSLGIEVD